jgi:hypothetical protein
VRVQQWGRHGCEVGSCQPAHRGRPHRRQDLYLHGDGDERERHKPAINGIKGRDGIDRAPRAASADCDGRTVILRFKVQSKPEKSDELLAVLAEIIPGARATEGVINFDIARSWTTRTR